MVFGVLGIDELVLTKSISPVFSETVPVEILVKWILLETRTS
jgi:hypothetical protein